MDSGRAASDRQADATHEMVPLYCAGNASFLFCFSFFYTWVWLRLDS